MSNAMGGSLFSAAEAQRQRDAGMSMAAESRRRILELGKQMAVRIAEARADRTCAADDVYRALLAQHVDLKILGNAAGSLFKDKQKWEIAGRKQSVRISNHSRWIFVWRLK